MYLSHPVRRMRADPEDGETVTLVVTGESEEELDSLAGAIEAVGGTVEDRLPYETLRITIDQADIDDLCSLEGIESIETDHVVGYTGDAGEDLDD